MKPHMKKVDGMWQCAGGVFIGWFPCFIFHAAGSGHSARSAYMDWANKLRLA